MSKPARNAPPPHSITPSVLSNDDKFVGVQTGAVALEMFRRLEGQLNLVLLLDALDDKLRKLFSCVVHCATVDDLSAADNGKVGAVATDVHHDALARTEFVKQLYAVGNGGFDEAHSLGTQAEEDGFHRFFVATDHAARANAGNRVLGKSIKTATDETIQQCGD